MDESALRLALHEAMVLGPMTRGGNLPFRRLCVEQGATVTVGEMALARSLSRGNKRELALLRKGPTEGCFGVQLAGNDPEEMAAAARLAEDRGADFIDLNLGCPIHDMVRRGIGAALLRKPARIGRLVAAMQDAVAVPVTVKIRLGHDDARRNHLEVGRIAAEEGAAAVFVHGRTRTQRYRADADWDAIAELAAELPVPVIGNGDILDGDQARSLRRASGCAGVMVARGALIKPWIFAEGEEGPQDRSSAQRLGLYRRYVALGLEHWGDDERGRTRLRDFLKWHLEFWARWVPPLEGRRPRMQEREERWDPRDPLEDLLRRRDAAGHAWLADRLLAGDDVDPRDAPAVSEQRARSGEKSWQV